MSGRHLGATALGIFAGTAGFAALQLAGYLLYVRVWGSSAPALVFVAVLFGAAGLYAGWILGMMVYSAVRDSRDGGRGTA